MIAMDVTEVTHKINYFSNKGVVAFSIRIIL